MENKNRLRFYSEFINEKDSHNEDNSNGSGKEIKSPKLKLY